MNKIKLFKFNTVVTSMDGVNQTVENWRKEAKVEIVSTSITAKDTDIYLSVVYVDKDTSKLFS